MLTRQESGLASPLTRFSSETGVKPLLETGLVSSLTRWSPSTHMV